MDRNIQKWTEMDRKGQKLTETDRKDTDRIGQLCTEMYRNGQKRTKRTETLETNRNKQKMTNVILRLFAHP